METVTQLILNIIKSLGHWAYVIVFFGPFLECSVFLGLLVPGETVMLLAGALSALGTLETRLAFSLATVGAVLGDNLSYLLGQLVDQSYFEKRDRFLLVRREHIHRVNTFFDRHGGKTIFFGRFLTGFRSVAPFAAGLVKMEYRTFFLYNVAGAVLWSAVFFGLGYFFGKNWQEIESWLQRLWYVLALALAFYLAYRYRQRLERFWKKLL